IEAISFNYASLYGDFLEVRLDEPLGPEIGKAKMEDTAKSFPSNKPEQSRNTTAKIKPMKGIRDLYFYLKKDQIFAQDLLRLDWIFFHEEDPTFQRMGHELRRKIRDLEELEPQQTPVLRELSPEKGRETYMFTRGDWRNPGKQVFPGI